ncbi:MAG TPA: nucleotidyl transferase AbiEii/AbiGii toxin family protein [Bacteroidales bacterium]|nr:nucleotidyl transferase AbiEii/AbiGii toxin family protein [Bacteroidales bacterium]
MLHTNTLTGEVLQLIRKLQEKPYLEEFYIVGGTGLALQIGHRKSDDIDLFTNNDFDNNRVLEKLEEDFEFQTDQVEKNTIKGTVHGIKVDLLSHKYTLLDQIQFLEKIRIASIKDIAAMKVNAVSNDGTRIKDFIDIYYLLETFSIEDILTFFSKKYALRNSLHALKSLTYFEEVNLSDWPDIIKNDKITWKKICSRIETASAQYIESLNA